MSAPLPDRAEPQGHSSGRQERPVLIEGGAGQRRLARVPFLVVLIGIFGIGMAGLLALNTTLQGQAFEASRLHDRANQLTYQEAALSSRVDALRSVDNLSARASKLGMRPNPDPAFMRVPDGKVIGNPHPVSGDEIPSLVVKTPQQKAAEKAAQEAEKRAAEAKKQAERAKREADEAAGRQQNQRNGGQNQQAAGQGTGNQQSGNQSGRGQSGDGRSDNGNGQNSGNQNSGNQNSGSQNSGNQNSGSQNSNSQNSNSQNSNNQNSNNQNSGNQTRSDQNGREGRDHG